MSPSNRSRHDSVLVVGSGIAGIQAALDLSEAGHHVFMVERALSTGGMVGRLDKMFPTNDCSFCTLAPRECFLCIRSPQFIDHGHRDKVRLLTGAELTKLDGMPGDFTAEIRVLPRYVDQDRCTACGKCSEVCPVEVDDQFNEGMSKRKAAFRPHPQSHPKAYAIDPVACTRCGKCVEACPEQCIDLNAAEKTTQLHVGAVILSPGFEPFHPTAARNLGYGIHPDVITSVEFERLVSASGPTGGKLRRPSDGRIPERIAWIQCVGSREAAEGRGYCSTVCCMYALKQAVLAKQALGEGTSAAIFGMDLRAYGKEYYHYFEDAQSQGVRFLRSRIFEVGIGGDALSIKHAEGPESIHKEDFDLVVLSVGLTAPSGVDSLADAAGIDLGAYNFCETPSLSPVLTSRPGVFAAGSFAGPKDIPDTITEASAAVAEAVKLLGAGSSDEWGELKLPPEREIGNQAPKIGVVLCRCGQRIADALSLPNIAASISSQSNVAWVETVDKACSPEGQRALRDLIAGSDVNRVVMGACSPRNYELLFRDTLREAGLNGYMLEMANLLEQCALVHTPGPATDAKAKDLMRMALGRARLLQPLARQVAPVTTPAALVLGGGLAGLTAASHLLDEGHELYLVEKNEQLGGLAQRIENTLEGIPIRSQVQALADKMASHPNAHVFASSRLESLEGQAGAFVARLRVGPQDKQVDVPVGAVIVATEGREYEPTEYLYAQDPRVVTSLRLDEMLAQSAPEAIGANNVVMIQCVGSRDENRGYCSRTCCSQSVKNALKIKQSNPEASVFVLYRDLVTYGLAEDYYRQARESGVMFLRWDPATPPVVEQVADGDGAAPLRVTVTDVALGEPLAIEADLVALAAATLPAEENESLAGALGVHLTSDGFFQEAHAKLRPMQFERAGIFLCGLAHGPKSAREQVAQAIAAAGKASTLLSKSQRVGGTEVAVVEGQCVACLTCVRVCPVGAPHIVGNKSQIDPMVCQGCGICVSQCPAAAIQLLNARGEQFAAQVTAWLEGVS